MRVRLSSVVADPRQIVDALDRAFGTKSELHSHLDVDVYRCRPGRDGPDWVVRAVDDTVGHASLTVVADILDALSQTRFPAERCAVAEPVLTIDTDSAPAHLLLTEFIDARSAPSQGFVLAWCAGLLAKLATKSGTTLPPGGGWHRLGLTPSAEIDAALQLTGQLGSAASELADLLANADDGHGLPEAVIHPDLTPPNVVPQGADPPRVVDWIGTGRGPRIWPLAFLLFAAGPGRAHFALQRYGRTISLTDEELQRLSSVMIARPVVLDIWAAAHERMTPRQAVERARKHRARVRAVVAALQSD